MKIEKWKAFWFRSYSPQFFTVYRFQLFLGALFFSFTSASYEQSCVNWAPQGVLFWLPCLPELLKWSAILAWVLCPLAAFGILYRFTSKLAFLALLVQWGMLISYGKISNSHHLMVMAIGILSFAKKSNEEESSINFGWAIRLIQVYVVWVYFVNGLSKVDIGSWRWAFSENLYLTLATRPYLGPLGAWLLSQPPWISSILAAYALYVVELGAPLALLKPKIGWIYFFIWASFHLATHFLLGGHEQFFSQIFVCAVFLPLDPIYRLTSNLKVRTSCHA